MLHLIVSLFFVALISNVCFSATWKPSKFNYHAGPDYQLVWQDEFENVGPIKGIIDGKPAYTPNSKHWVLKTGRINGCLQNYTDALHNAYVQDDQLTIVAEIEGYLSAVLSSVYLQEFTVDKFTTKIRLPYGKGIWPTYWLVGNAWDKYKLYWPTVGEIDILEMVGGQPSDQIAHGTVHWNNASNAMKPLTHVGNGKTYKTPDGSKLHDNSLVYWTEYIFFL